MSKLVINVADKESSEAVATLTERLAKAERERDECRNAFHEASEMRSAFRAERDEWQAQAKIAEGYLSEERAEIVDLRDERDAALAKAASAEKEVMECRDWGSEQERHLTELRARIEALADVEEKDGYTGRAFDLRALLQPPKAETALDVLARIEEQACGAGAKHYAKLQADMAKLRKLLEEKK